MNTNHPNIPLNLNVDFMYSLRCFDNSIFNETYRNHDLNKKIIRFNSKKQNVPFIISNFSSSQILTNNHIYVSHIIDIKLLKRNHESEISCTLV